jgi:hypothetical protein
LPLECSLRCRHKISRLERDGISRNES